MSLLDLKHLEHVLTTTAAVRAQGRVVRASGLILEASMPHVAVGTTCDVEGLDGKRLRAEVVGFSGNHALLMPLGDVDGISEGAVVTPRSSASTLPVGPALLGRIVDATMRPIDEGPLPLLPDRVALRSPAPPAMKRRRISKPFVTGIRAIDSCLTLGEGQRVAAMAGPGVGKSVLLGMLARSADCDVIVVGLIGERGREVREFVERDLGPGLKRSVVVVATADESPLRRVQAGAAATAVAEYFRAKGQRVLLLVDSLSRVAMAQREIGLASGEPPTSKGYPPSVFALLPRLVERAGNDAGTGSITAVYTVLSEGDDLTDPIADCARAALDGHLVLSRRLAESGQFPAVDMLASVSRVMTDVVDPRHLKIASQAREILASYRDSADLIELGAYQPGSNPKVDRALKLIGKLRTFLVQGPTERTPLPEALQQLSGLLEMEGAPRG
jgi:flagellum-specific ATP synthase